MSVSLLKSEALDLGLPGKKITDYVLTRQATEREGRARVREESEKIIK